MVAATTHETPRLSAPEAIHALQVLSANHGFSGDPLIWLEHPEVKDFRPVAARAIPHCPDCGGQSRGALGQYVYYSTLHRLQRCSSCDLVWSDAAIDPEVTRQHFESAYKDETYFKEGRAAVFNQLARLASRCTPRGGSVLDYGGGMGHLLNRLRELRPDISSTVLDISSRSVDYAQSHFGLKAVCGTLDDVLNQRYDVVICSDVIYYEPDLTACWEALSRISDTLIIRVPDKLFMISARQRVRRLLRGRLAQRIQSNVTGYNPEHSYILGRRYLRQRLSKLGYSVKVLPAVTLEPPGIKGAIARLVGPIARFFGLSSAMVVVATREQADIRSDVSGPAPVSGAAGQNRS